MITLLSSHSELTHLREEVTVTHNWEGALKNRDGVWNGHPGTKLNCSGTDRRHSCVVIDLGSHSKALVTGITRQILSYHCSTSKTAIQTDHCIGSTVFNMEEKELSTFIEILSYLILCIVRWRNMHILMVLYSWVMWLWVVSLLSALVYFPTVSQWTGIFIKIRIGILKCLIWTVCYFSFDYQVPLEL